VRRRRRARRAASVATVCDGVYHGERGLWERVRVPRSFAGQDPIESLPAQTLLAVRPKRSRPSVDERDGRPSGPLPEVTLRWVLAQRSPVLAIPGPVLAGFEFA
jgi:hypothetical protein